MNIKSSKLVVFAHLYVFDHLGKFVLRFRVLGSRDLLLSYFQLMSAFRRFPRKSGLENLQKKRFLKASRSLGSGRFHLSLPSTLSNFSPMFWKDA